MAVDFPRRLAEKHPVYSVGLEGERLNRLGAPEADQQLLLAHGHEREGLLTDSQIPSAEPDDGRAVPQYIFLVTVSVERVDLPAGQGRNHLLYLLEPLILADDGPDTLI